MVYKYYIFEIVYLYTHKCIYTIIFRFDIDKLHMDLCKYFCGLITLQLNET